MRLSDLKPGDTFRLATSDEVHTKTLASLQAITPTFDVIILHPDSYVEVVPRASALSGDVDLTYGRATIKIRGEWLEIYGPDSPDPVNRVRLP